MKEEDDGDDSVLVAEDDTVGTLFFGLDPLRRRFASDNATSADGRGGATGWDDVDGAFGFELEPRAAAELMTGGLYGDG